MSLKPATPPAHLLKPGATLWREMIAEFAISDPAGLALLATAAECVDRMRAAQKAIKEHGEIVVDRYGAPKLNPACSLEKDARNGMLASLRALNLDVEPLRDGAGRPPQSTDWKG